MTTSFNRTTGAPIDDLDHLRQSIADILSTPIGTRVMRRTYGSRIPSLIDAPLTPGTLLQIASAAAEALNAWEPRIAITAVRPQLDPAAPGRLTITLEVIERATGQPLTLITPIY